jgi:hypothetical protein
MMSSLTAKTGSSARGEQYGRPEVLHHTPTAYWRKSRSSGGANCVEVAMGPGSVQVRDSKNTGGAVLKFTREEWALFMIGVQRD